MTPQIKEEYKKYKANLRNYGFHPVKRDFLVFRDYMIEKCNDPALIVPQYIVHSYLTSILNPIPYNAYFEDKNMLDRILPQKYLPETLLRRMDGFWSDCDYKKITNPYQFLADSEIDGIIVKPARNSSSGRGVELFRKENGLWLSVKDRKEFSPATVSELWGNTDIIIQKIIAQDQFFCQFCDTSVNTMRIVIYNSPLNDEKHLIWTGLRIGKRGSNVDNIHGGGLMFGVSRDGRIAKYGADQYGTKFYEFNGVDFATNDFIVPNFQKIIDLCKEMAEYLIPHRFIAFDVAVESEGNPLIIEYNLRAYGGWACQFAGDPMFGDHTDEILKYLSENKSKGIKFFYNVN